MALNDKQISVIGPGMMGHGIAQEFALSGYPVILCGRADKRLEDALGKIKRNLEEMVSWGVAAAGDVNSALHNLRTTTDLAEAGAKADVVIESIVEDLDTKLDLFRTLDQICPEKTILASNTSSILPSTLASATQRPDKVLVAHYFNPPYLMPLVEIVRGQKTSDESTDRIWRLVKKIGKSPIVCRKEAPGFVVNRLQLVMWREAFNIVQRGIASAEEVDLAVKKSFGRRMGIAGPFEIFEHNDGYDLTLQCEKYILPDMDTSNESYPLLHQKIERGELGAKTGKGFYHWTPEFTEAWRKKMTRNLIGYLKADKE